jgi:hypothetical protein
MNKWVKTIGVAKEMSGKQDKLCCSALQYNVLLCHTITFMDTGQNLVFDEPSEHDISNGNHDYLQSSRTMNKWVKQYELLKNEESKISYAAVPYNVLLCQMITFTQAEPCIR